MQPEDPVTQQPLDGDSPAPLPADADDAASDDLASAPARSRGRSASIAAVFSFVWPGLGQLYRGRRLPALLHALPPLVLAIAVAAAAAGGLEHLALRLLTPQVALGATAIVAALGLWRIVSIFDARRRAPPEPPDRHPRRSLFVAALLGLVVLATHGYAGYYTFSFYRAGQEIYEPVTAVEPTPAPSVAVDPEATPPPTLAPGATPAPTAPPPSGMINVLFVGIDRGPTRANTNTDTLLFASFDPATGRIVMISLPRDTALVPLYNGEIWPRKINAFYHYAESHPEEFPLGGMGSLVREVEYLLGVPIHYYASIEMDGFWEMIDLVGGVDVYLEEAINDPVYQLEPEPAPRGFFLEPGWHHLTGRSALAYVRSRHGPGNSDYVRARRQQQVLLALRERLRDPGVILNLPTLLEAAGRTVRTDVPLERMSEFVQLVQSTQGGEAEHFVLAPRRYAEIIPRDEFTAFGTRLKLDEVARLSIELFGLESRYAREGIPSTESPDPSEPEFP